MLFPKYKNYSINTLADLSEAVVDITNKQNRAINLLRFAMLCIDIALIGHMIQSEHKMNEMQDEIDALKAKEHTPQED